MYYQNIQCFSQTGTLRLTPLFSSILCTLGIFYFSFLAWPRQATPTQYSDAHIYLDFQMYTSLAICQNITFPRIFRAMSPVLAALGHRLQPHHPLIIYLPFQSYWSQIRSSHVITKILGYRWINILVISLAIIFKIGSPGRYFPLLCYRRSWNGFSVTKTSFSEEFAGDEARRLSTINIEDNQHLAIAFIKILGYPWANNLIILRAILFRGREPWKSDAIVSKLSIKHINCCVTVWQIALSSLEACFKRFYESLNLTEFRSFVAYLFRFTPGMMVLWKSRFTWTEEQFIITEYNIHQSITGIFPLLL